MARKPSPRRHKVKVAAKPEPRRRQGGRSARVRTSVLQAAFAVLAEKGFQAFAIAEVAERAGVHETSIYRRWGDKQTLVLEASLHFAEDAAPIPDTGALRSDLVALLEGLVAMMASPRGQALVAMSVAKHPEGVAARQTYWRRRLEAMRIILDRAVTRGEFPGSADRTAFLEALIAPLYLRALVTGKPIEEWPYDEMIDRLLSAYAR